MTQEGNHGGQYRVKKAAVNRRADGIFALDIGTRSIIGMVDGEKEKSGSLPFEGKKHTETGDVDGQIEEYR